MGSTIPGFLNIVTDYSTKQQLQSSQYFKNRFSKIYKFKVVSFYNKV